ncbi:hypothetical protein K504DRAFT_122659 [Pleomassaria siparia CBS 279.74]|uniref:Uncharacterized protein n=1 Tax=Pleomassaria siparia CBS 279.74 TaxID=1314801 RepID=A0A6G1KJ99_9PLEO|nr:hypothetical protein K504DRAFT_122659 [Pleomassaria siparia CBS 279.74]
MYVESRRTMYKPRPLLGPKPRSRGIASICPPCIYVLYLGSSSIRRSIEFVICDWLASYPSLGRESISIIY